MRFHCFIKLGFFTLLFGLYDFNRYSIIFLVEFKNSFGLFETVFRRQKWPQSMLISNKINIVVEKKGLTKLFKTNHNRTDTKVYQELRMDASSQNSIRA